ncbi:Maf family protein [Mycobacteroides abscessus]|uniref:Maf family protein n=1 Tax=Mycobacteroides abscessus TaxID=36809 RepID=UPI000C26B11C|nr:Maf family protein [Mycobacteroides abscessus]
MTATPGLRASGSTTFVLASASPARERILEQAGLNPVVIVSHVDEHLVMATQPSGTPPSRAVEVLASAKAFDVATALAGEVAADAVVLGCDSLLLLDGSLQGKPGTVKEARRRWELMAGRSAELLTGHCLVRVLDGKPVARVSETRSTTVRFGTPSADDLEAYLATGEPLQVAGAFTLDGLGGWFIDGIDGDPSNVIGVSVPLVGRLLNKLGVSASSLWIRHEKHVPPKPFHPDTPTVPALPPRMVPLSDSLVMIGPTQQQEFKDAQGIPIPHMPSVNTSFQIACDNDSFDLGVHTNRGACLWTGDYLNTGDGIQLIPVDPARPSVALGGRTKPLALPENAQNGARLLPTGSAQLAHRSFLFASCIPAPGCSTFVSADTTVYDVSEPGQTTYHPVGVMAGISQPSGVSAPGRRMLVAGNIGTGPWAPRLAWLTPPIDDPAFLDSSAREKLGQIKGGGDRENQLFALPAGGFGLLDANGSGDAHIGLKLFRTPQELVSEPMTVLIRNDPSDPRADDPFISRDPHKLLQPYGPQVVNITMNADGTQTLYFLVSQWVTDPTRAYRTILYSIVLAPQYLSI